MNKRALITGITGQDGSYLAEYLLWLGYEVYGLVRWASVPGLERIAHIRDEITLLKGDLLDSGSLVRALQESRPDEIYNLAAMSFVPVSFEQPLLTAEITGLGALRLLEAMRQVCPEAKFYQASSSEMFGSSPAPQTETTPFHPRSPYGAAKVFAHNAVVNYREAYGLWAVSGILFNHESPRRGLEFVTRKITDGVARIKLGLADILTLGSLDAKRDWGYAGDYVRAMWTMLQRGRPEDYVVATGQTWEVRQFADRAFQCIGKNMGDHIRVDHHLFRAAEVEELRGVSSKMPHLDWRPSVTFDWLIEDMVRADLKRLK